MDHGLHFKVPSELFFGVLVDSEGCPHGNGLWSGLDIAS